MREVPAKADRAGSIHDGAETVDGRPLAASDNGQAVDSDPAADHDHHRGHEHDHHDHHRGHEHEHHDHHRGHEHEHHDHHRGHEHDHQNQYHDDHAHDHDQHHDDHAHGARRPFGPMVLILPLIAALALRNRVGFFGDEELRLWSTLFVSVCIQALPFLVLGVVVSGLIAAFVSPDLVQRIVPRRTALAIPSAGLAGMALPGCECGSVPIAGRLVAAGTPPAAALTFLLAAPAINPVVLASTAVAFPNDGRLVLARFVASFVAAMAVGTWWARRNDQSLLDSLRHEHEPDGTRWQRFVDVASRDLVHAGGYLVVGALAAATLQLIVPRSVIDSVAGSELASVLMFAALAVLLSICSEADAFVVAGLPQFSLTSRLVFLVVGPVIDLKLVAMHAGIFGREFALRFAPVTLAVAVGSAVVIGQVLL